MSESITVFLSALLFRTILVGAVLLVVKYIYEGVFMMAGMLLLALVAETTVPALINLWRVRSGRWLAVSRAYRPSADE